MRLLGSVRPKIRPTLQLSAASAAWVVNFPSFLSLHGRLSRVIRPSSGASRAGRCVRFPPAALDSRSHNWTVPATPRSLERDGTVSAAVINHFCSQTPSAKVPGPSSACINDARRSDASFR